MSSAIVEQPESVAAPSADTQTKPPAEIAAEQFAAYSNTHGSRGTRFAKNLVKCPLDCALTLVENVRVFAAANPLTAPLQIVLLPTYYDDRIPVATLLAALDRKIKDDAGAVLAKVHFFANKKYATAEETFEHIASITRNGMLCLGHEHTLPENARCTVDSRQTIIPSIADRASLRADLLAHPNAILKQCGPRNTNYYAALGLDDEADIDDEALPFSWIYDIPAATLDAAESELMRRGYVAPTKRQKVGGTLYDFIRSPYVRDDIENYYEDVSGQMFEELHRYLGLVIALL